jgi:hypothetical protein
MKPTKNCLKIGEWGKERTIKELIQSKYNICILCDECH